MTPAAPPTLPDDAPLDPHRAENRFERASARTIRSLADIAQVREELLELAREWGYDDSAQFAIRLAVEEALANAVRYGEPERRDEPVRVCYEVTEQCVRVRITDPGPGFDPDSIPDPTAEDRLDLPTGRGILIMRAFMTDVRYNEKGNEVTLTYTRPKAG